ncbi:hypothetical protein T484DRAFT_1915981 [Baffinella frigidus]|nr:hypothetical protein T484DRAFT_1915981 [Cryptophyta sp. CCMP2293]
MDRKGEGCDELLSCIDDMRGINNASPAPALEDLETTLQRMAFDDEHREEEVLADTVDVCSPTAARSQDTRGKVRHSSLRHASTGKHETPSLLWFDAAAVAAAAAGPAGSRAAVKLAMQNSMRQCRSEC